MNIYHIINYRILQFRIDLIPRSQKLKLNNLCWYLISGLSCIQYKIFRKTHQTFLTATLLIFKENMTILTKK